MDFSFLAVDAGKASHAREAVRVERIQRYAVPFVNRYHIRQTLPQKGAIDGTAEHIIESALYEFGAVGAFTGPYPRMHGDFEVGTNQRRYILAGGNYLQKLRAEPGLSAGKAL